VRQSGGPPEPRQPGALPGFTTRAAILGLVICALVVSAAIPLREYLSRRGEIDAQQQKLAAAKQRVENLQEQLRLLQDPAYVKQQARTRLHFVLPGETAYVVLTPAPKPVPSGKAALTGVTATGPEAPWYSQVWGSVKAADHPAALPSSQLSPRASSQLSPRASSQASPQP
jgi:cell division protein FtsB